MAKAKSSQNLLNEEAQSFLPWKRPGEVSEKLSKHRLITAPLPQRDEFPATLPLETARFPLHLAGVVQDTPFLGRMLILVQSGCIESMKRHITISNTFL